MATKKQTKKSKKISGDICPFCNKVHGVRKNLGKTCTPEDIQILKMIDNRYLAASDAANPVRFDNNISKEQLATFLAAAFDFKAKTLLEKDAWWTEMKARHELPNYKPGHNLNVDLNTGEFYLYEEF